MIRGWAEFAAFDIPQVASHWLSEELKESPLSVGKWQAIVNVGLVGRFGPTQHALGWAERLTPDQLETISCLAQAEAYALAEEIEIRQRIGLPLTHSEAMRRDNLECALFVLHQAGRREEIVGSLEIIDSMAQGMELTIPDKIPDRLKEVGPLPDVWWCIVD